MSIGILLNVLQQNIATHELSIQQLESMVNISNILSLQKEIGKARFFLQSYQRDLTTINATRTMPASTASFLLATLSTEQLNLQSRKALYKYLIEKGADADYRLNIHHDTLLFKLLKEQNPPTELIEWLLTEHQVDPNIRDQDECLVTQLGLSRDTFDIIAPYLKKFTPLERYVKPIGALIAQTIYNVVTATISPFVFAAEWAYLGYRDAMKGRNNHNPMREFGAFLLGGVYGFVWGGWGASGALFVYELKSIYNNIYRTMICGEANLSNIPVKRDRSLARDVREFFTGAIYANDAAEDYLLYEGRTQIGVKVADSLASSITRSPHLISTGLVKIKDSDFISHNPVARFAFEVGYHVARDAVSGRSSSDHRR